MDHIDSICLTFLHRVISKMYQKHLVLTKRGRVCKWIRQFHCAQATAQFVTVTPAISLNSKVSTFYPSPFTMSLQTPFSSELTSLEATQVQNDQVTDQCRVRITSLAKQISASITRMKALPMWSLLFSKSVSVHATIIFLAPLIRTQPSRVG